MLHIIFPDHLLGIDVQIRRDEDRCELVDADGFIYAYGSTAEELTDYAERMGASVVAGRAE